MAQPFVWAWRVVGLRWVPARARLPARLALLYAATASLLWWLLPPRPRLVVQSGGEVQPLGFTADGQTLAAFDLVKSGRRSKAEQVRLWEVATGRPLVVYRIPDGVSLPTSVDRFSKIGPDGRTLVLCLSDEDTYRVEVWDLTTGRLRLNCRAPFNAQVHRPRAPGTWDPLWYSSIAISQDGRRVALVAGESTATDPDPEPEPSQSAVYVWDTTTGQLLRKFRHTAAFNGHARFAQDGRRLAVDAIIEPEPAVKTSGIVIYDLEQGGIVTTLTHCYHGAFTADGRQFWTYSAGGGTGLRVMVGDLPTGGPLRPVCQAPDPRHTAWASDNLLFPDRGVIVSADQDTSAAWPGWVVEAAEWVGADAAFAQRPVTRITLTALPSGMQTRLTAPGTASIASDGKSLAVATGDGELQFWDLPLRPPWPLILCGAAVPPGLVLLAVVVRRGWRQSRLPTHIGADT